MDEDRAPRSALELRVHGVHGTSPQSMLGVEAAQVAGDKLTGLYRAKGDLPYRRVRDGHAVEAYSWGALTSGVQGFFGWVRRVLWLTLLPFAFVNVAHWSRFYIDTDRPDQWGREARSGARCVRWAGLLLTVLLVLTPCLLFVDLVAWQCYGLKVNGCPRLPDAMDFLAGFSVPRRMAIASLIPVGLVLMLCVLARATQARYEAFEDTSNAGKDSFADPLRSKDMWNGKQLCEDLRALHIAVGLSTVVLFSGTRMLTFEREMTVWWWVTSVSAAAVIIAALWKSGSRDLPASNVWRLSKLREVWVAMAAAGVTVVHLLLLWFVEVDTKPDNLPFRFNNVWFLSVMVGLIGCTAVLFLARFGRRFTVIGTSLAVALPLLIWFASPDGVTGVWLAALFGLGGLVWLAMMGLHRTRPTAQASMDTPVRPSRATSSAWRGAGPAVLLGAGAWIALLFTSAAVIGMADYLNGSEDGVGQLDTAREGAGPARPEGSITVAGDVVIDGAVLRAPKDGSTQPVEIVGGSLRATSAVNTVEAADPTPATSPAYDVDAALFDQAAIPMGTVVVMPGDVVKFVNSCEVSTESELTSCRPSDGSFLPQGSISAVQGFSVATREVTLEISDAPQRALVVPQVLIWTPLVQLLWLIVVGPALGAAALFYRLRAGKVIRNATFGTDGDINKATLGEIKSRRVMAGLAHRAEPLTDVVSSITTLLGLVLVIGASSGQAPWKVAGLGFLQPISTLALYAAVGSSLLLVLLGSYVRRSESTRKAVGILWDLTTFWPRAAHPLAPPCYAERVVPELAIRIRWAARRGALVVLSGHSQGSLLAVAAVSRLADGHLKNVRMLTYGSQIRALYGRVFPAVFGPHIIGNEPTVGAPTFSAAFPDAPDDPDEPDPPPYSAPSGTLRWRLKQENWINLFRRTDPLGYRVFGDFDSDWDLPVREVPINDVGDPGPFVGAHSGYQHTPEYRAVATWWLREVPVTPTTAVAPVPALPLD